jgi:hypothetical protein
MQKPTADVVCDKYGALNCAEQRHLNENLVRIMDDPHNIHKLM